MKKAVEVFATSLVATVLLVVAHFILQPAPVPALSGLAGGLMAYWMARRQRNASMAVGWLVGTVIGMAVHFYSHFSEGRLGEPPEGMPWHLLLDAARGAAVAVPILAISILLVGRWSTTNP